MQHPAISRLRGATPLPDEILDRVHRLHPGFRLTFFPQGQHAGHWGLLLREGTWRWREAGYLRTRHYQRYPEAVKPDTWYEIEAQLDGDHLVDVEHRYGFFGSDVWLARLTGIVREREAWQRRMQAHARQREPKTVEEMMAKYPELNTEIDEMAKEAWPVMRGQRHFPVYQRKGA